MKRFVLFVSLLSISGCAPKYDEICKNKTVSQIFNDGIEKLNKREYEDAHTIFKSEDEMYPYSATAATSQVFMAYASFKREKYLDSIRELELFINYHPSHELIPYAMYLRGLCFLKQAAKVGRSQESTMKAKIAFVHLIRAFPESEYAKEADKMIIKLDNSVAANEMCIAKHYHFEQKNLSAALGRYSSVVFNFPHTNQAPEALYRICECYCGIGLKTQALDAYEKLNKIFAGTTWAKKSNNTIKPILDSWGSK